MKEFKIFHSEIEEFENIENFIEGFLSDYWCFDDTQKSGFKYQFKELQKKYSIKSSTKTHVLAKKFGQAKLRIHLLCNNCVGEVTFRDRKEFSDYNPYPPFNSPNVKGFCPSCYQSSLSEDIDKNVQNIYKNIEHAQSFFKEPTLDKLSYLEAIFLYHIINFQDFNPKEIDKHYWMEFYESECEGAHFVIDRLVTKGFIKINLNEKDIFDNLNEIKMHYGLNSEHLSSDFLSELNEKLQIINDFIYSVTLPKDFSNFHNYSLFLQNKINSQTVLFDDLKDIKRFVTHKRHDELFRQFHNICKQIKINSQKLENNDTLNLIAENLNLMQAYSLFWYKTTEVKAAKYDQYTLRQGYKKLSAIYLNAVKKYVEYIASNPTAAKYSKNLPDDFQGTKIEKLIFSDFLDIYYNYWHKLTTKEIIKLWLDELTVEG